MNAGQALVLHSLERGSQVTDILTDVKEDRLTDTHMNRQTDV